MTLFASFFVLVSEASKPSIDDSYTLSKVFHVARGSQHGSQKAAKFHTFGLFFRPGPKWGPRGAQEVPKGAQKGSRGNQGGPKSGSEGAKEVPKLEKGSRGSPGAPKRGPGGAPGAHGGGKAAGNWISAAPRLRGSRAC